MKQLFKIFSFFGRSILVGIVALYVSNLIYGESEHIPFQNHAKAMSFSEVFLRHQANQWADSSELRFRVDLSGNRLVLDLDPRGIPQALSFSNSYLRIGKLDLGTDFRSLANPLGLPLSLSQIPSIPLRPSVTPTDLPNLGVALTLTNLVSSPITLASSLGVVPNLKGWDLFSYTQGSGFFPLPDLKLSGLVWFWQRWVESGNLDSGLVGARVSLEHRKIPWFLWFSAGTPGLDEGVWIGSGIGGRFGIIPRSIPTQGALQYQVHLWTQGATMPVEGITRKVLEERRQFLVYQAIDLRSKPVQLQPILQVRVDSTSQNLTIDWLTSLLLTQREYGNRLSVKAEAQGVTENLLDWETRDWWFSQLRFGLESSLEVELSLIRILFSAEYRFLVEPGLQSRGDASISGDLPKAKDFVTRYGVQLANQGTKLDWAILGKVEILGSLGDMIGLKPSLSLKWSLVLPNKDSAKTREILAFEFAYKMNQAMEPNWFRGLNPGFFLSSPGMKLGLVEFQWSLSSKTGN